MAHDTDNPTTANPETEPPASTETPAAKRERASYPIRLMREDGETFAKPSGPEFSTIEQAERWILRDGEPGVTYLLARVIGARRRPKPTLEEVTL